MRTPNHNRVYIQELSACDGFQIAPQFVPTPQKIDYINRLSLTGLAKIEVTSYSAPAAMPALADAEAVLSRVSRPPGVAYTALVHSVRGGERALALIGQIVSIGITRITLCDTTGVSNPSQVERLFVDCKHRWPQSDFTAHSHNTRGMGLANALATLEAGIDRFDASLGSLGGCPFAPGATGNVCTENLVHMPQSMGYETGVDLDALPLIAADLPALVGHEVPGQVVKAGRSSRRYPLPSPMAADAQHHVPPASCSVPAR